MKFQIEYSKLLKKFQRNELIFLLIIYSFLQCKLARNERTRLVIGAHRPISKEMIPCWRKPLRNQSTFEGKIKNLDTEQSCSYTCFSFYGNVDIEVKSPEKINSFKILPSSKHIKGKVEGNRLSFNLDKPEKLAIVINNDYLNPLFLFADAPEQEVPDKTKKGTLVVKEGDDIELVKEKAKTASVIYFEPEISYSNLVCNWSQLTLVSADVCFFSYSVHYNNFVQWMISSFNCSFVH